MMNLPPEVKVDILKYFNFNQLLTIQQTNSTFNEFINANENQLPLKQFVYIQFSCVNGSYLYNYLFDPAPKLYDFELSKRLEEKWKCGIEKSLPMFLIENNNNSCMIFYDFLKNREEDTNNLEILFPNIPKNIEEMKIARYLFQQLFTCAFEFVHFYHGIINPQMVELLFDDNKLNIPLQIHSECSYIYMFNSNYDNCLLLKSIFNHMLSNDFIIIGIVNDQTLETLFKFVTNGENNFNRVYFNQNDYPKLNDFIIKHIETGDVFKMVRKLIFSVTQKPIISKHAKNIEIKVGDNNLKCTKYQLSNKWDPEMKFCIYNREKAIYVGSDLRPAFDVEIKRTN